MNQEYFVLLCKINQLKKEYRPNTSHVNPKLLSTHRSEGFAQESEYDYKVGMSSIVVKSMHR